MVSYVEDERDVTLLLWDKQSIVSPICSFKFWKTDEKYLNSDEIDYISPYDDNDNFDKEEAYLVDDDEQCDFSTEDDEQCDEINAAAMNSNKSNITFLNAL
jgi:hypothetical protein